MKSKTQTILSCGTIACVATATLNAKAEKSLGQILQEPIYRDINIKSLSDVLGLGHNVRTQGGWETKHVVVRSLAKGQQGVSFVWRGPFEDENLQATIKALGAQRTFNITFARSSNEAHCFDQAPLSSTLFQTKIRKHLAALKIYSLPSYAAEIQSAYVPGLRNGDHWPNPRYYRFYVLDLRGKPAVVFSLEEIRGTQYCYLGGGALEGNSPNIPTSMTAFTQELARIKQSIDTKKQATRERNARTKNMWQPR